MNTFNSPMSGFETNAATVRNQDNLCNDGYPFKKSLLFVKLIENSEGGRLNDESFSNRSAMTEKRIQHG